MKRGAMKVSAMEVAITNLKKAQHLEKPNLLIKKERMIMRKSFHQTLSILAICLLLSQTIFGSLPVFAQTTSDTLTITMTENGQPYTEGSIATSPVTIQVVTTSPDSAGIELSQDLGTTWKPYDTAVPLVLEDAGNHDIWFRLTDSDGQAVIEKRHIQITTAALLSRQATGPVIYVDANSTAANGGDGTSWATACKDLQAALSAAGAGQEIWIAKGTYKPTTGTDRTNSFQMKNGVAIYGGFKGDETTPVERDARDFKTNKTILSGDIGAVGNTDNAYHVFYHPADLNLDNTAILDGVTITGGNADTSSFPHNSGGGMYNVISSPTVTNVVFRENTANYSGGGMSNNSSTSPIVTNVEFSGNKATIGGGMSNYNSIPTVTNVEFSGNEVTNSGGGMSNESSSLTVTNVAFRENKANYSGGGMSNSSSSLTVTNVKFSGNTADSGGGMSNSNSSPTVTNVAFRENTATNHGGGMFNQISSSPTLTNITMSGNTMNDPHDNAAIYNADSASVPTIHNSIIVGNNGPAYNGTVTIKNSLIGDDQKGQLYDSAGVPDGKDHQIEDIFIDHTKKDYCLKAGSPAIDKGENSDNTTLTDLDGNSRVHGGVIDLGAYEYHVSSYTVTFDSNGGSAIAALSVPDKTRISEPTPAPTKAGYTFKGWYKDGAFTSAWDFAKDVVTANIKLYAQWAPKPTYTVTYNGNGATGGQAPSNESYEENATVTVQGNTGNLVKSNHIFTGWNTQADGKGTAYAAGATFQMGKAAVTLYAQWKVNPPTPGGDTTPPPTSSDDNTYLPPTTVKITLHSNDGTIIEPINITYNTKVSDLPVPTRAGFRFEGWYEDEALTKRWADGTLVRENIALYAKWTALPAVEPEPETPQEPQPPTLPQPTVTFGDVEQHWAQEMIEELATLGIIQGFEDGTFHPNAPINRMHVAALLTRAFPFENVREGKAFSDVSPAHPYYEAILTLQQAGIIDGTNGAFLPKENMTRVELAKVLVGVLGLTPEGTASFSDVASTHWSTGYIAVLEREGIALGDNGKYGPNDPVTRAQFVTFLSRILQLQEQ